MPAKKTYSVETGGKIKISNTVILFIVFVVLFAIFSYIGRPFFFSALNFEYILINFSFTGIIAVVLAMVIVTGEIDFSIGGNIGLTSCLAALLISKGVPGWLVIIIALCGGALMGAFNGFLTTVLGVNSLIATIGTMFAWRSIGYALTKGESMLAINPVIDYLGRGYLFKIVPFPVVLFIIVFIIIFVVMNLSKLGRRIYAIGTNSMASHLLGTNVKKIKFIGFLFCGIAASLGGLIMASLSGIGTPQHGEGLELVIISGIVLGGTALGGGRGKIPGVLAGIIILILLNNFLTIMNVHYYYLQIVQSAIFIVVISIDSLKNRRKLQLG